MKFKMFIECDDQYMIFDVLLYWVNEEWFGFWRCYMDELVMEGMFKQVQVVVVRLQNE